MIGNVTLETQWDSFWNTRKAIWSHCHMYNNNLVSLDIPKWYEKIICNVLANRANPDFLLSYKQKELRMNINYHLDEILLVMTREIVSVISHVWNSLASTIKIRNDTTQFMLSLSKRCTIWLSLNIRRKGDAIFTISTPIKNSDCVDRTYPITQLLQLLFIVYFNVLHFRYTMLSLLKFVFFDGVKRRLVKDIWDTKVMGAH